MRAGSTRRSEPPPRPRERAAAATTSIAADAAAVATHLHSIRRLLREAVMAQAEGYPVTLTAPQLQTLELVVDRLRSGSKGPSIRELSEQLGLSHSTVSGIVDRLEDANVMARSSDPDDRRLRRVGLTSAALRWVQEELPAARRLPLATAMAGASAQERRAVRQGLALLERLLARAAHDARDQGALTGP